MIKTIDDVPMLVRREIEARILAPFVEALADRFDRDTVIEMLRGTVQELARQNGQELASSCGGNDLAAFGQVTAKWSEGGALELDVLQSDDERCDFNVTRCQYAEMYERLGIPELGEVLSCNRDFTASEGFNVRLHLARTQTIMGGASHCDFRYQLRPRKGDEPDRSASGPEVDIDPRPR